jgi:hypothetical protein
VNPHPETSKSQGMDLIIIQNNQNGFSDVAEAARSTDLVRSKMESHLDRFVEIPLKYAVKGLKCIPRTNLVSMENRELRWLNKPISKDVSLYIYELVGKMSDLGIIAMHIAMQTWDIPLLRLQGAPSDIKNAICQRHVRWAFGQTHHTGPQHCVWDWEIRKECKSKVGVYDRKVGSISGIRSRGRNKCISSMIWWTWDMKMELKAEGLSAEFHTFGSRL